MMWFHIKSYRMRGNRLQTSLSGCDDVGKCNLVPHNQRHQFFTERYHAGLQWILQSVMHRKASLGALRAYSMSLTPKGHAWQGSFSYQEKHTDRSNLPGSVERGSVGEHGFSDGKYRAWT